MYCACPNLGFNGASMISTSPLMVKHHAQNLGQTRLNEGEDRGVFHVYHTDFIPVLTEKSLFTESVSTIETLVVSYTYIHVHVMQKYAS